MGKAPLQPPVAEVDRWLPSAAAMLGIDAEPVEGTFAGVDRLLTGSTPALLQLPAGQLGFLAVVRSRRGRLLLLGPDRQSRWVPTQAVTRVLRAPLEEPAALKAEQLLAMAGIARGRLAQGRAALLREQLGSEVVTHLWRLQMSPGASLWALLRRTGVPLHLAGFLGAHAVQYGLWLLSWWVIGRAVLGGRLDPVWLGAWALLLMAMVPFRLLATWLQGVLAIEFGRVLRRRLIFGALKLDPEELRREGAGQLLGRVLESEAVESLAVSGGLLTAVAALELLAAAAVLATTSPSLALLLVAWTGFTAWLAWGYLQRRRSWTDSRLDVTHELVESMVGHRTRLVQQLPERWHEGEEALLHRYLQLSVWLDRALSMLAAVAPRGWLLLGLLGIALGLAGSRLASVALVLGAVLLAFQALTSLAAGLSHLAGAVVAAEKVSLLFSAAARDQPVAAQPDAPAPAGADLIQARDLGYSYPGRSEPALENCRLDIRQGDRILLEGPSGSGKSTLAAILAGLRLPQLGALRLEGADRAAVDFERWRHRVALAPQFHENHVVLGPLAFNLLMGRRWPPRPEDLAEAEGLLRELGLGPLVDRMPSGLQQMVGETGWRLSHGEQSLIFMARALLQGADLLLLDESFGALDPERMRTALQCVNQRAPTLLVIAQ